MTNASLPDWPPQTVQDVFDLDHQEVLDGYLSFEPDDPVPGPNRSVSYRWGWHNRRFDHTRKMDEHYSLRRQVARIYLDAWKTTKQ